MDSREQSPAPRAVLVPAVRVVPWWRNFEDRHGAVALSVAGGALVGAAADGARAVARLPFAASYDGPPDPAVLAARAANPLPWALLLVRKGGFAVATVRGGTVLTSKVGQRHVQGRTKAGGQSQQRFARRRDNQARQAYEAAAEHAHRVLVREATIVPAHLVCGGDRGAVEAVLADPRLRAVAQLRVEPWLPVGDPRRAVLDRAVVDGSAVRVELGPDA